MIIESKNALIDFTYPHVMGILNMTPDSFSDGGQFNNLDKALLHVDNMISAGATFIDVGGESTRPGANEVSVDEELDRVIPIIEKIANYFEIWISVDTSKPQVITAAADAGAHLINDVRALSMPGALEAAVKSALPVCLMHMQGNPKTMQNTIHYDDIITDLDKFFEAQIKRCILAGINKKKIMLDPGFGFGKSLNHNYKILHHLEHFLHFDVPILVGMSRKTMIGQVLNTSPNDRMIGSVTAAVIAAMKGAKIIRVHDVKETFDALRIVQATLNVD